MKIRFQIAILFLVFIGINKVKGEDSISVKEIYVQLIEFETRNKTRQNSMQKSKHETIRLHYSIMGEKLQTKVLSKYVNKSKWYIIGDADKKKDEIIRKNKRFVNTVKVERFNKLLAIIKTSNSVDNRVGFEKSTFDKIERKNSYDLTIVTSNNDTIRMSKEISRKGVSSSWNINPGNIFVSSKEIDKLFLSLVKDKLIGVRRLKKTL